MVGVTAALTVAANAEPFSLVVPNAFEDIEGDLSDNPEFYAVGTRWQQVIPAQEFAALTGAPHWITEIAIRPDHQVVAPRTVTWQDAAIRMSTTAKGLGELSMVFAENAGLDESVVFDGTLVLDTAATGPPEGPRAFDYTIELTQPFFYDPSEGNFLIDFMSLSGSDQSVIVDLFNSDTHFGGNTWIWTTNPTDATASTRFSSGLIWNLIVARVVTGDTNKNGDVDIDDLNNVRNNFGATGSLDGSLAGDAYPFDGIVNIDDLNAVRNHFSTGTNNAVPEPGAGGLAVLAVILALGARPLRQSQRGDRE
jgi:hypothetical protein